MVNLKEKFKTLKEKNKVIAAISKFLDKDNYMIIKLILVAVLSVIASVIFEHTVYRIIDPQYISNNRMMLVALIIMFIGIHKRYVIRTPNKPEVNPIITVSALNILETSCLDAPIARRIPISLVRSCTEIRVITPIIMEETTKEIETKAIKT